MPNHRTPLRVAATAALLLLATATAARAGIHYIQEQTTESEGRGGSAGDTQVEGWAQGDKAKIIFRETGKDMPFMKEGQYLITEDGGKTVFLADPEKETLTEWDLEAMFGMVGGLMDAMGEFVNIEFENPHVEKLDSKSGESILGMATTYTKYRTTYRLNMKIMGMSRSQDVDTVQEIWSTDKPTDLALGVWLQRRPAFSGIDGLDELLKSEMDKLDEVGFPLKSIQRTTQTQYGRKGKEKGTQSMTMTSRVTAWDESDIDDAVFMIPDWERVSMADAIPQAAERPDEADKGDEGEKKKGLRGLFHRK